MGVTPHGVMLSHAGANATNAGSGLVHIQPSPSGRTLVVAGYGSGTVAAIRLDTATGFISASDVPVVVHHNGSSKCTTQPAASRQNSSHPHSVARFKNTCVVLTNTRSYFGVTHSPHSVQHTLSIQSTIVQPLHINFILTLRH